jgi:cytochrome b561
MSMSLDAPVKRAMRGAVPDALPAAKILHWISAILLLAMFASGIVMTQLPGGATADFLYTAHKSCGAIVLILLTLRLLHRLIATGRRQWPAAGSGRFVHWLMYAVAIAIPIIGWAAVSDFGARGLFFGLALPEIIAKGSGYADMLFDAHAIMASALIGLVIIHVALALNDYITRGR